MNDDRVPCQGCLTDNPFLCRSFSGTAPRHARRHAEWLKQRAKDRAREQNRERAEELLAAEPRVFRRGES